MRRVAGGESWRKIGQYHGQLSYFFEPYAYTGHQRVKDETSHFSSSYNSHYFFLGINFKLLERKEKYKR